MFRLSRHIIAGMLTVILLVFTSSQLLTSVISAHIGPGAFQEECRGDCDLCGCPPEQRAFHTCCCWQKKLRQGRIARRDIQAPCCRKSRGTTAVITTTCSCKNRKSVVMWDDGGSEFLPNPCAALAYACVPGTLPATPDEYLTEHPEKPPVPPPEHAIILPYAV